MKTCAYCGTYCDEGHSFCFECGKAFPQEAINLGTKRVKTCDYCGAYGEERHLFCFKCGQALPEIIKEIRIGAEYAGFWRRFVAYILDVIILGFIQAPLSFILLILPYSYYYYFGPIISVLYIVGFWAKKSRTPGKMALGITIVTEDGKSISTGRALIRYFGYIVCGFSPFWLGFWWIIWDKKKQGWHDKLANTYVIKS
jgi:uncharacterized RDD family membrane protein YckC